MSTITEILRSGKKPAKKLEAIVAIVAKVRKSYGNEDEIISMPEITTCDGQRPLSTLSVETKLALADQKVQSIVTTVLETAKTIEGLNVEKYAESLIATDETLVNLDAKVSLGFL